MIDAEASSQSISPLKLPPLIADDLLKTEDGEQGRLLWRLMRPFTVVSSPTLDLSLLELRVASSGSPELAMALDLVSYSYDSRYLENYTGSPMAGVDLIGITPNTRTIVAVQTIGSTPVVIGTFRIVFGNDLDVFRLFAMESGRFWPHESPSNWGHQKAAELERFSLHPALDLPRIASDTEGKSLASLHKRLVLRELWRFGMKLIEREAVKVPYFIMAPHVHRFVESAGIVATPVEGAVPSASPFACEVRRRWRRYWKPDSPAFERPYVFLAPRDLRPLPS